MRRKSNVSMSRRRASTSEVLGLGQDTSGVKGRWAEQFRDLTALKDRFTQEKYARTENAKEEIPTFSEHMADAATDLYDRDWALAALSSANSILHETEAALKRIQAGTYGICELTGQRIDAARLRAIPWTRFSAEAQADLEARGVGARFHLGQLGGYGKDSVTEEEGEDGEVSRLSTPDREAA